jgi:hypothetical protein
MYFLTILILDSYMRIDSQGCKIRNGSSKCVIEGSTRRKARSRLAPRGHARVSCCSIRPLPFQGAGVSRSQRCSRRREGVGSYRLLNGQAHFRKCCRTLAAIWRSVILSTVSTPTMRPPSLFFTRRFLSSPFASPGPNIRMESASRIHAITAS